MEDQGMLLEPSREADEAKIRAGAAVPIRTLEPIGGGGGTYCTIMATSKASSTEHMQPRAPSSTSVFKPAPISGVLISHKIIGFCQLWTTSQGQMVLSACFSGAVKF